MGDVYRVHDAERGCAVALKTLRDLAPEQTYRLKSEFRFIAGPSHPKLVQLHDLVVTDDLAPDLLRGGACAPVHWTDLRTTTSAPSGPGVRG